MAASYAPGVVPQSEAAKEGYSQNLWLLGDEHILTEVRMSFRILSFIADNVKVGTMNLFVAFKQPDGTIELVTPPLDDVVLPGVTRDR